MTTSTLGTIQEDIATIAENVQHMRGVIPKQDTYAALDRIETEVTRLIGAIESANLALARARQRA